MKFSEDQLPAGWAYKRLKHVADLRSGEGITSESIEDTGAYPVYGGNGPRGFTSSFTHDGEFVLIGRQGALCGNVHQVAGRFWASEHAVVATFYAGYNPKWARHLFEYLQLGQYSVAAAQPGLAVDRIKELGIPVPTVDLQSAIAAYLDAETARIDALIGEKTRLVELLTELRGGIIRERTSGLDRKVSMRKTGHQFMPLVPADWDFVPVGRYATITNGSTPLKDNADFWTGGYFPWMNSAVVNLDEVTEGSEFVTDVALRQCHLPIVPSGSVLVALTGQGKTRGQATLLRIEATINQHLAAIVCDQDHLDGEFLFWVLTGQYSALRMVSDGQGGTKGALTCDELGRFPIPKPPVEEQREVAKALYAETRKIDDLLRHVSDEIVMMHELRSSTIADAVLGRIDIRNHTRR